MRALLAISILCVAAAPADAARRRKAPAPPPVVAPEREPPVILLAPPPVKIGAYIPRLDLPPPTLPSTVRAMIDAATTGDDPAAVAAVVKVARQTNPAFTAEIDRLYAAWNDRIRARREAVDRAARERLEAAGVLDNWKGEIEAGASRSTGNSSSLGLYGAVGFTREGIDWRHKLSGRIDVQETNGATTTERASLSWQPNYKVDDRLYAYGLGQYEHDRFLGYDHRLTLGGGMGYGVIAEKTMKLDIEGGPALRYTDFIDDPARTTVAGRASLAFRWSITPTLQLAQNAAVYVESGNSDASATTSLDTRLIGSLKARFSYNVKYEGDAPAGRDAVDTLSRATLVYSF